MKNQQKAISNGEKLDIIGWLEKGEWIVGICHNIRLGHSSIHTIRDNAVRITESANSRTKVQDYHSPIGMNYTKNYGCETLYCIRNK